MGVENTCKSKRHRKRKVLVKFNAKQTNDQQMKRKMYKKVNVSDSNSQFDK